MMSCSLKVKVTNISTSHRYGIIAAEDIRCSETLVEIPRNIALTPNQGSIASRLREFKEANMARLVNYAVKSAKNNISIQDREW